MRKFLSDLIRFKSLSSVMLCGILMMVSLSAMGIMVFGNHVAPEKTPENMVAADGVNLRIDVFVRNQSGGYDHHRQEGGIWGGGSHTNPFTVADMFTISTNYWLTWRPGFLGTSTFGITMTLTSLNPHFYIQSATMYHRHPDNWNEKGSSQNLTIPAAAGGVIYTEDWRGNNNHGRTVDIYIEYRHFSLQHTVTNASGAANTAMGTISTPTPNVTVLNGLAKISVTAKANPGYKFVGWWVQRSSPFPPAQGTPAQTWVQDSTAETITHSGCRTDGISGNYSNVYVLSSFSGVMLLGPLDIKTGVITTQVQARFDLQTYTLGFTSNNTTMGTVSRTPTITDVPFGTSVTLNAAVTVANGYRIDRWTDGGAPVTSIAGSGISGIGTGTGSVTFNMPARAMTIQVVFVQINYTIEIEAICLGFSPSTTKHPNLAPGVVTLTGGASSDNTGADTTPGGSPVGFAKLSLAYASTFTVSANTTGRHFAGWFTNAQGTGTALSTATTLPSPHNSVPINGIKYFAIYRPLLQTITTGIILRLPNSTTGVLTSTLTLNSYYGDSQTLTATPLQEYSFVGWSEVATGATVLSATTYPNPLTWSVIANVNRYAVYAPVAFTVTYARQITNSDGTPADITGNPALTDNNAVQTLYITQNTNATLKQDIAQAATFQFLGWFVEGNTNPISTALTLYVPAITYKNQTITARFQRRSVDIIFAHAEVAGTWGRALSGTAYYVTVNGTKVDAGSTMSLLVGTTVSVTSYSANSFYSMTTPTEPYDVPTANATRTSLWTARYTATGFVFDAYNSSPAEGGSGINFGTVLLPTNIFTDDVKAADATPMSISGTYSIATSANYIYSHVRFEISIGSGVWTTLTTVASGGTGQRIEYNVSTGAFTLHFLRTVWGANGTNFAYANGQVFLRAIIVRKVEVTLVVGTDSTATSLPSGILANGSGVTIGTVEALAANTAGNYASAKYVMDAGTPLRLTRQTTTNTVSNYLSPVWHVGEEALKEHQSLDSTHDTILLDAKYTDSHLIIYCYYQVKSFNLTFTQTLEERTHTQSGVALGTWGNVSVTYWRFNKNDTNDAVTVTNTNIVNVPYTYNIEINATVASGFASIVQFTNSTTPPPNAPPIVMGTTVLTAALTDNNTKASTTSTTLSMPNSTSAINVRYFYREVTINANIEFTNAGLNRAEHIDNFSPRGFSNKKIARPPNTLDANHTADINRGMATGNDTDVHAKLIALDLNEYLFKGFVIQFNDNQYYSTAGVSTSLLLSAGLGLVSGHPLYMMSTTTTSPNYGYAQRADSLYGGRQTIIYKFVQGMDVISLFNLMGRSLTHDIITIHYLFEYNAVRLNFKAFAPSNITIASDTDYAWNGTTGEVGDILFTVNRTAPTPATSMTGKKFITKDSTFNVTLRPKNGTAFTLASIKLNGVVLSSPQVTPVVCYGKPWQFGADFTFSTNPTNQASAINFEFTFNRQSFMVNLSTNLHDLAYKYGTQPPITANTTVDGRITLKQEVSGRFDDVGAITRQITGGNYVYNISASLALGQSLELKSEQYIGRYNTASAFYGVNYLQFVGYFIKDTNTRLTVSPLYYITGLEANWDIEARYSMQGAITLSAASAPSPPGLSPLAGSILLVTAPSGASYAYLISGSADYRVLIPANSGYTITLITNVYYEAKFTDGGGTTTLSNHVIVNLGNAGAVFNFLSKDFDETQTYVGSTIIL
ncbi:MAG: hypothetical protein FWE53_02220 [Firmicutes bacterium]|nr:hypothetical protein [Bacillota bacterium]